MTNTSKIPKWAFEEATPADHQRVIAAHQKGSLQIEWPDSKELKSWMRQQGWRVPWFQFKQYLISKMILSETTFTKVLEDSGVKMAIPINLYKVSKKELKLWDEWYEEREDLGTLGVRPTGWGPLVESLREIRRIIEIGVKVEIEDRTLQSVGQFLSWVDKRYHMLEDGYDSWVGDDKS